MHSLRIACVAFVLLQLYVGTSQAAKIPPSHRINVPYHMQVTDYCCGDASVQMVMEYYGTKVSQYSLIDLMRTTSDSGTYSYDIQRAGHFSVLSSSPGILFPNASLPHGYPNRTLGLASFWHDSPTPWMDELKALIAADIPVITLMHWIPNGTNDGHYRVVVGYDDTRGEITMNDPWDRGYPPIPTWSNALFLEAWHYYEPNSTRTNPYFGAAFIEWKIEVTTHHSTKDAEVSTITARVTYPCPPPFDCRQYEASNTIVSIDFGSLLGTVDILKPAASMNFGTLKAGGSVDAVWVIRCEGGCSGISATITGSGIVHGSVPETELNEKHTYPPYSYHDIIGSQLKYTIP